MAKMRDVLLKLEVRTSLRANKCRRNGNHQIRKGDLWLIVTARGPAARDFGYCVNCGTEMLEAAQASLSVHLAALRKRAA
jgi:hypothetical protein